MVSNVIGFCVKAIFPFHVENYGLSLAPPRENQGSGWLLLQYNSILILPKMSNATTDQLTTVETAKDLGVLPEEFQKIKEILGRTPNFTELSIFSVMWSEHCSYKNSITWLKTLPREGSKMLVEAGYANSAICSRLCGIGCEGIYISRVL